LDSFPNILLPLNEFAEGKEAKTELNPILKYINIDFSKT
jgi:hypothetical protein